jgi:hypothetical protein
MMLHKDPQNSDLKQQQCIISCSYVSWSSCYWQRLQLSGFNWIGPLSETAGKLGSGQDAGVARHLFLLHKTFSWDSSACSLQQSSWSCWDFLSFILELCQCHFHCTVLGKVSHRSVRFSWREDYKRAWIPEGMLHCELSLKTNTSDEVGEVEGTGCWENMHDSDF